MKQLFLSLMLMLLPIAAQADAVEIGGIYYNLITKGKVAEVASNPNKYTGSIVIPATVTYNDVEYSVTSIADNAFYYCRGLTSVTIPNSVTSIGESAFYYCRGLTSVTIPNSVTSIGNDAFYHCSGLTSVTIPNSVTSIGNDAFYHCSGLTSVTIGNSVTSIGSSAFGSCSGIEVMSVESGNTVYDSRNNCNAIVETSTNTLISGCKNTIIPNSVTSIGSRAFYECRGLTSVTIPNSVTSIGESAFYYCSGLTSVSIPNSVTSIGSRAFCDCSGLTSVSIPNSVTSIGNDAFWGCSGLTSVTIGNSVTSIGEGAFRGCSGLTSVTIPGSVTSIGYWAFSECSGIEVMSVESGNTVYDSRNNCNAIVETSTNTLISGCKNTIIPNSVTSFDDGAFYGCRGLTSVTIPNSVTSIGIYAFSGCSGIEVMSVESGNTVYDSRNNCNAIVETSTNTLISGCKNTIIPNNVTSIGIYAFSGCSGLTSVTIPNSVTSIGYGAFESCSGLTSVTIPNRVTSIGSYAFSGCTGLTSVTIPNSVTSIGYGAFQCCSGLTSVTIPNSVTSIGSYAFFGCTGLISVTVENPEPIAIDASTFDNCANATLYVPAGAKAAYAAAGWSGFKEIVEKGVETTDVSQLDNVIYIEDTEARTGSEKTLSVRMKNTVDIAGFEFVLQLPEGVTIAKDADGLNEVALSTERTTAAKTNYFDSSLRTDGTLKVLCGTSKQNPDTQLLYTFSGTDGEVATIKLLVSEDMEEGEYPIVLKNIKVSDPNAVKYETEAVTSKLTVSTYTSGDVNGDGSIDVADFIAVANRILDRTPAAFIEKAGDINEDGTIDVADFIATANLILHSTASNSQQAPKATRRAATDIDALSDVIYVEPVTASAGTQQVLSVRMKNTAEVAGFEFCLQLPDGITIATEDGMNKVELSTERTTAAKTNYFDSSVQSNGMLKVLCGTSKENPSTHKLYTFSGNDGEVARITVNIPAGYQSGEYAVIVKNAIIADPDAQKTVLPDAETTLTVTEPLVLVLDETSTTVPEATTGPVDIKVKRTLKAGEWSTICLPFAMTEAQVKEAFGSDVELKEFVDYEAEYDADDNVTNIKVNFGDADLTEYGFEANFPYLIKVSADISEFTVNSTVEPDENDCYIEYDNGKTGSRRKVYGTFYGTLHAQTTVPENGLFLSGNKFWYSTGQTRMKAFRGYFEFVDVLSSVDASSARINLSFNGSETTGVSEVVNRKSEIENWYDLQGRRVEKPAKGLYIKGNKKVFVK